MEGEIVDVPTDANAGCPGTGSSQAGHAGACEGCPNQQGCQSTDPTQKSSNEIAIEQIGMQLRHSIKHKILVLSGKGGVGKSTFAAQLSFALLSAHKLRSNAAQNGSNGQQLDADCDSDDDAAPEVGLLDVDICGPSAPRMLGVEGSEVNSSLSGWQPVYARDRLSVMSVGFLLSSKNNAVIWRGVRKTSLITQFLRDVQWGMLDYLVVDAPPGTSDEHISLVQLLKQAGVDGAVLVTTPQEVSLMDVRKEVDFCRKSGTRILGIVENMAGFVCPSCSHCAPIFFESTGGARALCKEVDVPFLGSIPMDPELGRACEIGKSIFESKAGDQLSAGAKALEEVVLALLAQISPNRTE
mmetsp:Transcript_7691/g.13962  ORF Transcript_7691/g.13962 Transcript_7691/m.13962 type:complete len:355 (+) Transcript_7691:45-1109(+)